MDAFEPAVIADQDDIVDNGEQDGQDDASRGNGPGSCGYPRGCIY